MNTKEFPVSSPKQGRKMFTVSYSLSSDSVPDPEFQSTKHAESSLQHMSVYFMQGQLCDVTLVAGTKEIRAHRIVLCAASDYFTTMFTSPIVEARQEVIELKDMDPEALAAVVKYCYTGKIKLSEETVEEILATAHHLLLTEVVDACCHYLTKQLHPANTLGIQLFADRLGCLTLNLTATNYTEDHFMEVIEHQEFLQLPKSEINVLLNSDYLNVPSEETVFKALILWLGHDLDSRKQYLEELFALVKLPILSPQYLVDHVQPHPLLKDNMSCLNLILEAMMYHVIPGRRRQFPITRTSPRKSTVGNFYIVGGMYSNKVGPYNIERYDLRTNSWTSLTTMNCRRLQIGVAVKDKKIYVVGGRDGLKTLSTFDCYDPSNNTWTALPSMSTHRHGLGVGVLEGPLYAVGGHDGWSYLSTVERWDPQTRQWSFVASMSSARCTVGVAVLDGRLYAVGGRDGSSCLRTVECYNPHTNRWSLCCPMNLRRGGVAVVANNGLLYAIGGHDASASTPAASRFDSVERYDPATDTWTYVASMPVGCDSAAVGALGNKIFCVGGYDGQIYLNLLQCYDPRLNEWDTMAPLSVGRASACGAVICNQK